MQTHTGSAHSIHVRFSLQDHQSGRASTYAAAANSNGPPRMLIAPGRQVRVSVCAGGGALHQHVHGCNVLNVCGLTTHVAPRLHEFPVFTSSLGKCTMYRHINANNHGLRLASLWLQDTAAPGASKESGAATTATPLQRATHEVIKRGGATGLGNAKANLVHY